MNLGPEIDLIYAKIPDIIIGLILGILIVVITQIGNNFGYLHRLHFLASFLYISWI